MRGYGEDIVSEVRARSDIVEVVSEYVPLKLAGKTHKALCPFHGEKTPSFTVSAEKQLFYCFGCSAGGDVFSFVMKIENIGFPDAVKLLAERAGVALSDDESPQARAAREKRRLLYDTNEAACRYFERVLCESGEAAEAREYLRRRGLSDEIARGFRLGYATMAWDGALKALVKDGLTQETLLAAGLIVATRDGSGCYDRFRARLMFPIQEASGRVIGFGGRVLDDSLPKYVNSPETALFTKGKTLYGLNLAKNAIRNDSQAVIVEGYMDAIACHQHGFANVVASLGTALTLDQARSLSRYASDVIIAYDADAAGAAAALRGMEVLAKAGLRVKVAVLSTGEDPDSMLRKGGGDALARALRDAKPLLDYRLHLILSHVDRGRIDEKVAAARDVAKVLANVRSMVERTEYARKAARRLGVSEEALIRDVETLVAARGPDRTRRGRLSQDRFARTRHTSLKDDIAKSGEIPRVLEAEKMLLRIMAENKEVLLTVLGEIGTGGFRDARHAKMAQAMESCVLDESCDARERTASPARLMEFLANEDVLEYAAGILVGDGDELPGDPLKAARDCLDVIHEHNLRDRAREIEGELAVLSGTGEMTRSKELLAELGSLRKRLSEEFQPFAGTR